MYPYIGCRDTGRQNPKKQRLEHQYLCPDMNCKKERQDGENYHATRHGITKHLQVEHGWSKEQVKKVQPSQDLVRFVPAGMDPLQVVAAGLLHAGQIAESYRQWRNTVAGGLYIDPGVDANHRGRHALVLRSKKEKGQVYRLMMVSVIIIMVMIESSTLLWL